MATNRPEYYYHPAVGVVSPASLELFRLNSGKVAPTRAEMPPASAQPQPSLPPEPQLPSLSEPVTAEAPAQTLPEAPAQLVEADVTAPNTLMSQVPLPPPRTVRRPMTLYRTATCVVTGETLPLHNLIRFVINPQNEIMADLHEKLPGKAFFLKADRGTLQKAIWRNTFTSVARDTVTVPENLIEQIEKGLSKQALEAMNLARRAGQLVMGFAKIEEQLRKEAAGVYVVASDASDHGRLKLAKLARGLPILDFWTCAELSDALGEANTNHVLLGQGGLAEKLCRIANKLKAIRSDVK